MSQIEPGGTAQDRLYAEPPPAQAPATAGLARGVETDADRARDLEQDIHLALWRSLALFDERCALGTWTFRVAHNAAATHIGRGARTAPLVSLDDAGALSAPDNPESAMGEAQLLNRIRELVATLKHSDRSVMLLYLEGLEATAIGEIAGLSSANVAVKVHRIKAMLARHFAQGNPA